MRRSLIVVLAFLMFLPSAYARKKRPKAGEIVDSVYTDAKYDFQFTITGKWEARPMDPNDDYRLELTQKDYKIPPDLMQYPTLAKVPDLNVYIGKVEMSPPAFVDSVLSDSYKSDIKKDIMKPTQIVEEGVEFNGLRQTAKKIIKIDDKEAVQWEGVAEYTKKLGMGETIPRSYAVGVVGIKNGDYLLIFMLSCERTFFPEVFGEVLTMANSVKWPEKK
jgi:hypothetical protein